MSKKLFYYGSTASFSNPKSVEYDGTNEYTGFGALSGLVGATEYSISMWIKVLAFPTQFDARYWGDAGGFMYIRCNNANTGDIQFIHSGGGDSGVQTLSLNTWTHIVLTKKTSSQSLLYKNAATGIGANSANTGNLTNAFRMGGIGVAGYQVNMRVNLWEVWNLYLTQANVTELYNGGVPINPATASFAANLAHNYRSGNGTDVYPTMNDYTGSANGTMVNMEAGDFVTDAP